MSRILKLNIEEHQMLATAILRQAFLDIKSGSPHEREEAVEWLTTPSQGLLFWIQVLGIEPIKGIRLLRHKSAKLMKMYGGNGDAGGS